MLSELVTCFSRDPHANSDAPRRVQDNMRLHRERLVRLLLEEDSVLYVCGDARNMARQGECAVGKLGHKISSARKTISLLNSSLCVGNYSKFPISVMDTVTSCVAEVLDIGEKEAKARVADIVVSGKYLQDVWT